MRLSRFAAGLLLALCPSGAGADDGVLLRVMAANTTSGNQQSYPNPGPGTRIFQALQPDVVLIQEFNVNATRNAANGSAAVDAWVDDVFGTDYHWFREPGGDSIPNGVISRWPIVESGEWRDSVASNRDFVFARIDVPGDVDLWLVSVHFLTRNASTRDRQARALVQAIRDHPVPADDYLIVGGDFNTNRRNEPALATLRAVVDTLGPFPDDRDDPPDGDTNSRRRKPYDWVLSDGDLEALGVATEVGGLSFPAGLVFDTRIFTQDELDESFPPARRNDSGASQMQHMAVVRDFRLPSGLPPNGDDFTVTADRLDFGTVQPSFDATVDVDVKRPFALVAVDFSGSHSKEFTLSEPDLSAGPVRLDAAAALVFTWRPATLDGEPRRVTATVVTDGRPDSFEVDLTGAISAVGGEPLDAGGFRLEQTGGPASLEIPAGTMLEPGGFLVIGRAASRAEFEAFWGRLGDNVTYLDGSSLVGDPGFPLINGGERYRLLDAAGVQVDPAAGTLPAGAASRGHAYEREATDRETFSARDDPMLDATPGRYPGTAAGTGDLVITEFSDAPGAGSFVFEFVEIFYDSAP